MTVGQLKSILRDLNDDYPVAISQETQTEIEQVVQIFFCMDENKLVLCSHYGDVNDCDQDLTPEELGVV